MGRVLDIENTYCVSIKLTILLFVIVCDFIVQSNPAPTKFKRFNENFAVAECSLLESFEKDYQNTSPHKSDGDNREIIMLSLQC